MNAASIQAAWPLTRGSRPSVVAARSRSSATIGSQEPINLALSAAYTRRWQRWRIQPRDLLETGRLRRSFTDDHALDALRKAHGRDAFEFGSTVPYSVFHSRKLLRALTPTEQRALEEAMLDYFVTERGDDVSNPFGE